jgi:hypothetical protein
MRNDVATNVLNEKNFGHAAAKGFAEHGGKRIAMILIVGVTPMVLKMDNATLSNRFRATANGVVRASIGLPPRRGMTNQPRATPWVGESNTIQQP